MTPHPVTRPILKGPRLARCQRRELWLGMLLTFLALGLFQAGGSRGTHWTLGGPATPSGPSRTPGTGARGSVDPEKGIHEAPASPSLAAFDLGDSIGEDLYAEQVCAELAGNETLIHNALVTTSSLAWPGIDLAEPGFRGCSFVLSFTNGEPSPVARPVTGEQALPLPTAQNMVGYLYFSIPDLEASVADCMHWIVVNLEGFLGVELKVLTPSTGPGYALYPLVGFSQVSEAVEAALFRECLGFLPRDGYFAHMDATAARITSAEYLATRHAAVTIAYLHELAVLDQMQAVLEEAQFAPEDSRGGHVLDVRALVNDNPLHSALTQFLAQLDRTADESAVGVTGQVVADMADLYAQWEPASVREEIEGVTDLLFVDVVHEPLGRGPTALNGTTAPGNEGRFQFDFADALDLTAGTRFQASPRSHQSVLGWLSGLGVILHAATPTWVSRESFPVVTADLLSFRYALYLADQEADFQKFFNCEMRVGFLAQGGSARLVSWPEDPGDTDTIAYEYIGYLLPAGLPVLSGVLVGPIETFRFQYELVTDDPVLQLLKTFPDGGLQVGGHTNGQAGELVLGTVPHATWTPQGQTHVDFCLEFHNPGTMDVWGVPVRLLENRGLANEAPSGLITRALVDLGFDPAAMFSNATPRFFPLDPFGDGAFVGFFPEVFNLSVVAPYSQEYSRVVVENAAAIAARTPYDAAYVLEYALDFNCSESIYNPANWVVHPGESKRIEFGRDLVSLYYARDVSRASNYTREVLQAAAIKYSSASGLVTRTARSNEILIQREHDFAGGRHRITQAVTAHARLDATSSGSCPGPLCNLTIWNHGTTPLHNVTVTLARPPLTGVESASFQPWNQSTTWTHARSLVGAGETVRNLTFACRVPQAVILPPIVVEGAWAVACPETSLLARNATSNAPSSPADFLARVGSNSVGLARSGGTSIPPARPVLRVTPLPTVYTGNLSLGQSLAIAYRVENAGQVPVNNLSLALPVNATLTAGLRVLGTSGAGSGPLAGATLLPGETCQVQVTYQFYRAEGTVVPPLPLRVDEAHLFVVEHNFTLVGAPRVSIHKHLAGAVTVPGRVVTVTVTLANEGNCTLYGITLDDSLSYDTRGLRLKTGRLFERVAELAPRARVVLQYALEVRAGGTFVLEACHASFPYGVIHAMESNGERVVVVPLTGIVGGMAGAASLLAVAVVLRQRFQRARADEAANTRTRESARGEHEKQEREGVHS